ncbi:hypothetical protein CRE_22040 [Caenorhabditis remanei]|uniref:F-box domain-containing protein n=1 Tax=Caenorhabditis remanei TaxID=31234 RepID=E3N3I2_CAERE|nr:hypothetical protein CRE_22040 [Caenorhabditis remanei]
MSSPFPLLRLPRLVLFDVFKSLRIGEKIKLSLCSKRISTQIYNARLYSQKVIVDLDCLTHKIRVCSEDHRDAFKVFTYPDPYLESHNSDIQQLPIACRAVRHTSIYIGITFLSAIRHLLKMFQCKFSTSIRSYIGGSYQPTLPKLFDLQMEFKTLTIEFYEFKDLNFLWNKMFSKFGLVEDLSLSSSFYPDFRPVFTSWPQTINILNSDWFTVEHLLKCTCSRITLFNSTLGNKDLDVVLRKWKTGGFPNLKCMKISSQNITNKGTTILGMHLRELSKKVIQTDDETKKAIIKNGFSRIEVYVIQF